MLVCVGVCGAYVCPFVLFAFNYSEHKCFYNRLALQGLVRIQTLVRASWHLARLLLLCSSMLYCNSVVQHVDLI